MPLKLIVDRQNAPSELVEEMGLKEYIVEAKEVEDWLYCIHNAAHVVTDSFHGTLFSIIFHRNFASINNPKRGATRFISLLGDLGLKDRLVEESSSADDVLSVLQVEIDYPEVDKTLDAQVQAAKDWLEKALHAPLPAPTGYDILLDEQNRLNRKISGLQEELTAREAEIQKLKQGADGSAAEGASADGPTVRITGNSGTGEAPVQRRDIRDALWRTARKIKHRLLRR